MFKTDYLYSLLFLDIMEDRLRPLQKCEQSNQAKIKHTVGTIWFLVVSSLFDKCIGGIGLKKQYLEGVTIKLRIILHI